MKEMEVNVTRKHIREGLTGSFTGCPVAKAVLESLPKAERTRTAVYVAAQRIRISPFDQREDELLYANDAKIRAWIVEFDRTGRVQPIRIKMELDEERGILQARMMDEEQDDEPHPAIAFKPTAEKRELLLAA